MNIIKHTIDSIAKAAAWVPRIFRVMGSRIARPRFRLSHRLRFSQEDLLGFEKIALRETENG